MTFNYFVYQCAADAHKYVFAGFLLHSDAERFVAFQSLYYKGIIEFGMCALADITTVGHMNIAFYGKEVGQ